MGKNSGKKYHMAFCVVKENIPARTVKYNIFIAVKFLITRLSLES